MSGVAGGRELIVQLFKGFTGSWQAIIRRLPALPVNAAAASEKDKAGSSAEEKSRSVPGEYPQGTELLLNLSEMVFI